MALCAGASTTLSPTATTLVAQTKAKSVEGRVFGGNSQPLPGAIVYLQDQKTYIIKTFIATQDGSYRFGQLPPDTDYSLWAEYKGEKSKTRTISSFDTKLDTTYDFHLKSSWTAPARREIEAVAGTCLVSAQSLSGAVAAALFCCTK